MLFISKRKFDFKDSWDKKIHNLYKNRIKVKIKFKKFYKNPISGKWDFLYTHCPYCDKKAKIRKKNIGIGGVGTREFIYCNDCIIKGIIKTKLNVFCPKKHLIKNKLVRKRKKTLFFYCETCGGLYRIIDCIRSDKERIE